MAVRWWVLACACLGLAAGCRDGGSATADGGTEGATDGGSGDADDDDDDDDDEGDDDDDDGPPGATCVPFVDAYDVSSPDAVIGDGSPGSCTSAALTSAVSAGGTIVFDCGADPVTIALDNTLTPPLDRNTIIAGGGLVTLDAQGNGRHLIFDDPGWIDGGTTLVLQGLRFINGAAPTGELFPQNPNQPECAYGYKEGSGGAVYVRNGILHVIDCVFEDNVAAMIGPDVGGGAVHAQGVPQAVFVGSVFRNNRASTGGAIGLLWATPAIYNCVFENNTAEGFGENFVAPGCPEFNHDEQGGAGGNGGAVVFDGPNDEAAEYTVCGSSFVGNRANELGGALFRTPNVGIRRMLIDRSTFADNSARMGGVSFIKQAQLTVRGSTFSGNRSGVLVDGTSAEPGPFGGLWTDTSTVDIENSTFVDNAPRGLDVNVGSGSVKNATFVGSGLAGDLTVTNSVFVDTTCDQPVGGGSSVQWPEGAACVSGIAFGDPEVDTLGDHGGPTPTVMPAGDGAAVGIGVECPEIDQRGEARDPASCAAGAVEP